MESVMDTQDTVEGRRGEWMHTSTGGRFFPQDPRESEVRVSDIANGLASCCRYAGQTNIRLHYSVAEHSWLIAQHVLDADEGLKNTGVLEGIALLGLFHDASEAYLVDLPKAVKAGAGLPYKIMEYRVQRVILRKYRLMLMHNSYRHYIKGLDMRIVGTEKHVLMAHRLQKWAADDLEPLPVPIYCWEAPRAKAMWLEMYRRLATELKMNVEEYVI